MNVVSHVGYMHAHFIAAIVELAEGEGIIEVLCIARVDGKGGDRAHILACGHHFGSDTCINLLGGVVDIFGIAVRKAKLGQDGVHLGGVVARGAKYVDHLTCRTLLIFGP